MAKQIFQIDDAKTLDANMTELAERLKAIDADLGPVLGARLNQLADGKAAKDAVWDALLAAVPEIQA
jgi:hypothetical protein